MPGIELLTEEFITERPFPLIFVEMIVTRLEGWHARITYFQTALMQLCKQNIHPTSHTLV